MKVAIEADNSIDIDFTKFILVLNSTCKTFSFIKLPDDQFSSEYIDFNKEDSRINKKLASEGVGFGFYVTKREYANNYFYYRSKSTSVISFSHFSIY